MMQHCYNFVIPVQSNHVPTLAFGLIKQELELATQIVWPRVGVDHLPLCDGDGGQEDACSSQLQPGGVV